MTHAHTGPGDWIRRFHPAPDAPVRLVCFPHAGGAATYYFPVSRSLAPGIEVLPVQYPGRQERRTEPFVDDIRRLAELVTAELQDDLDKPLALFGHSMGATLAFEVAQLLRRQQVTPLVLFASGRRAPSCHRDEHVHEATDEAVVKELERVGGTYGDVLTDPEMLGMFLPAIRNDYKAAETYRYEPDEPLDCPVVVLTGDEDPYVTRDEAEAWRRHTTGGFTLHTLRGGHFFLAEHAAEVIRIISDTTASEQLPAGTRT